MGSHVSTAPSRLTLTAFGIAVLIGGSNFLAVKYSNAELAPMYGAALRFTGAAVIFAALAFAFSLPLPRGAAMRGNVIYGVLAFGGAYGLLYFAMLEIGVGTAAVIMATIPLFVLVLAVAHGQERLTAGGILGGVLAIVGIAVLSLRSLSGDLSLLHVGAAVLGALAAAESTVLVKGFPSADPVTSNAVGMAAGALLLWIGSAVLSEPWTVPRSAPTWAAVVWLATAGSVAMFYLVLFLIGRWKASAAMYTMALMPVVAVALGVLVAGEAITPEIVAGAALVMFAVYFGALRRRPDQPAEQPAGLPGGQ